MSNNSLIFAWSVGTKNLHLWCKNGNCVKTFTKHRANVKAQNVNAGFILVYQTTDSDKNSVISLFIQMMWFFQPQHRILLYNLTVSHSIKKLNTFVGPDGSSVYIKKIYFFKLCFNIILLSKSPSCTWCPSSWFFN